MHPVSLIPPVVADTVERSYGHHRTPWFEDILERIARSLAPLLPTGFTPLILTATVSGAREAIVTNCVAPGVELWLSRPDGPLASLVESPRDTDTPQALLALIDHVDASGHVLPVGHTVRSLRQRAAEAVVVLDASVSFGADVATLASEDVDGVVLVPEGALMGIPGLSIVAAGPRLLDHIRRCRTRQAVRPYYFDLLKYEKNWAKRTTPYSPDISACVALCKALELIEENGGLTAHVARHAIRAQGIRASLRELGWRCVEDDVTNAFTVCRPPDGVTAAQAIELAAAQAIHATTIHIANEDWVRLDHTGYLPERATDVGAAFRRPGDAGVGAAFRPVDTDVGAAFRRPMFDVQPAAGIPPAPPLPIFDIPPGEFAAQAATHARRSGNGHEYETLISRAAAATFREQHRYDAASLAARSVGFIGAGNIVRETVARCQQIGMHRLIVYSPSLARQKRTGRSTDSRTHHRSLEYWLSRGISVAESAEEVLLQAHSIVLLPWFYDRAALAVFDKPAEYLNERLIDARALSRIEREGRADLIVNAAARGKLIDRDAVLDAASAGWLRYYSDELPSSADPLLPLRNVRFTGHVGGSCRRTQALVGRNTHQILRGLVAHLVDGAPLQVSSENGYSLNVLNAGLEPQHGWRPEVGHAERPRRVRVLITDPFDVEALDFDSIRAQGWDVEVLDVSAEQPTTDRLAHHLREFRPHILMLRSRTRIDPTVASTACEIPELAAIVRPGVGIDNLYAGARQLTEAGIRIINEPFGNSAAVAEMTMHFLVSAAENTLLAPGPTRVEPEVFAVMHNYRHPASRDIGRAIADVARRFAAWMGASAPAVVVSGSGTALMEAGIVNLTEPGDRGLVISHGKFGDRFADIARATGRVVDVLAVPEPEWGRGISPSQVEAHLAASASRNAAAGGQRLSFLCLQQNETSSGIAYRADHLHAIVHAARAHNPDMIVVVDAISGAFAHRIDFDTLDIDVLIVGSQKGLGVSSGLAFGQISRRAWNKMLGLAGYSGTFEQWLAEPEPSTWLRRFANRQRVWYLSLPRLAYEQWRLAFTDPPSAFHVLSTQRALDLHHRYGGREAVIARHSALAAFTRARMAAIGLGIMADPAHASDSVTPVLLPSGVTASTVRKQLEPLYGFSIAGAQGDYWKQQMVRIGHLGFVYEADIARCLRGLQKVLEAELAGLARDRTASGVATAGRS